MRTSRLWYVRRGDDRKGPYPAALIERNIALGRIRPSDELSHDDAHWQPATEYPDYEALVHSGREPARQRRLDERERERRAAAQDAAPGQRRGQDRRAPEPLDVARRRALAHRVWASLRPMHRRATRTMLGLALIIVAVVALSIKWVRPPPRSAVDCAAPAAPGVVWDFCQRPAADLARADLRGASLRNTSFVGATLAAARLAGADLAYADLTGADLSEAGLTGSRLTGASLRGTKLAGADFTDADLAFVDLTGARLDGIVFAGAKLGNAVWTDGKPCGRDSLGGCLRNAAADPAGR